MSEIKALVRPEQLDAVVHALRQLPDPPGITVSDVRAFGRLHKAGAAEEDMFGETVMTKVEVVVPSQDAVRVVRLIAAAAHTGSGHGEQTHA